MPKKSLLLVTRNFPPLVGGMEKLNFHIYQSLLEYYEVSLAGPKGSSAYHDQKNFIEFSPAPQLLYVFSSLVKTVFFAVKQKPKLVFCGSGAAILAGFFAAKFTGSKLVCYLHGLDIIADSFIYQNVFLPFIRRSDLILVNSNHSRGLAISAGINSERVNVLSPGTVIPDASDRELKAEKFRKKYNVNDGPLLLIVGRLTARKGIKEFVVNVMPAVLNAHPNAQLIIIGGEASAAIHKQLGIQEKIQHVITSMNIANNIHFLGVVGDDVLSDAFFSANALVFPVLELKNDVEGFGMVAIEAAAHGIPTIAFSVGGIPDAIGQGESGWLIPSGDYGRMTDEIVRLLDSSSSASLPREKIIGYAKKFEWVQFDGKLQKYLNSIL